MTTPKETRTDSPTADLSKKVEVGFAQMEAGFKRADERMDALDKKMDAGFEKADKKMDAGFEKADKKMDAGFARVDSDIRELRRDMNAGFDKLTRWLLGGALSIICTLLASHFS